MQITTKKKYLHNNVVKDGLEPSWPLQEVVHLTLQTAVARIAAARAIIEGFTQQTHAGLVQTSALLLLLLLLLGGLPPLRLGQPATTSVMLTHFPYIATVHCVGT